jgi:hypothetical protein
MPLWTSLWIRGVIHGETVTPWSGETVISLAPNHGETVTPSYMYL